MKALELLETDQDVFMYVRDHLLRQKQPSKDKMGMECLYKSDSDDGLMCAVGCLISDVNYNPGLEQKNIANPDIMEALDRSMPRWLVNKKLLTKLQIIHDNKPVEEWKDCLDDLGDSLYENN